MNLTHRNRVEYSRLSRLKIQRCGPPSPAGRANAAHPSCSFTEKGDKKSPPRWGGGDRSFSQFTKAQGELREAIAVGEIPHTDALSRLI